MATAYKLISGISGISIVSVASDTAAGLATIAVASTDTLTFKANGGTTGSAVSIADGDTETLADGSDSAQSVTVSRNTSDDLDTDATATLLVLGGDDTATRLAEVDDAISKCLKAQASDAEGLSIQRAQLADLRSYRAELVQEMMQENGVSQSAVGFNLSNLQV